ncbi:hypothetical protein BDM02DRAFT_3116762 [Thelephora ganbajun]|uniref:Uncharacterized protein n=1 Tax=Thelephora ganbajun TaxID=370292 RepID=A0ACB6ZDK0_THEGA|nr:hypothetical protein BDM02DRAFT_3116762 [Thelephora ganbajun]
MAAAHRFHLTIRPFGWLPHAYPPTPSRRVVPLPAQVLPQAPSPPQWQKSLSEDPHSR